ncbi:hypothetical protein A9Q91_06020 [Candidatus Gracilibacteria bacterium 28_42_T64]|nr:hypothetical protein A9Q91_06020 [Candidatus Gracilibacteria bacterium 28_42_T64]
MSNSLDGFTDQIVETFSKITLIKAVTFVVFLILTKINAFSDIPLPIYVVAGGIAALLAFKNEKAYGWGVATYIVTLLCIMPYINEWSIAIIATGLVMAVSICGIYAIRQKAVYLGIVSAFILACSINQVSQFTLEQINDVNIENFDHRNRGI